MAARRVRITRLGLDHGGGTLAAVGEATGVVVTGDLRRGGEVRTTEGLGVEVAEGMGAEAAGLAPGVLGAPLPLPALL